MTLSSGRIEWRPMKDILRGFRSAKNLLYNFIRLIWLLLIFKEEDSDLSCGFDIQFSKLFDCQCLASASIASNYPFLRARRNVEACSA